LATLILIFELTGKESKKRDQFLYLLLLTGWTALLPWLSWRLFYTITMREAYFALTPVNFYLPSIDTKLLWLSIPVLVLTGRIIAFNRHCGLDQQSSQNKRLRIKPAMTAKILILNCLLVVVITAGCAYAMYNRRSNTINRMAFDLQHSHFDSVITAGKDNPTNNRLICYLTNIALYESGQMPYRLFHYKQMGTAGLLLNWEFANSSNLVWFLGEVYYRLGMILQAEHCAFESFVSSHKGFDVKVLQRLALTNIARRDAATANKYLRYLDHSFFYRQWARQQRVNLALAMADPAFHIPDTPIPARCNDFFIPYQMPEYTLLMLLESNPKHRMAFEYLMAYCMLQRDLEKVKWCIDNYYGNFDYPAIPTLYEEALLLYKNVYNEGPDFFTRYPISNAALERYDRYIQAVNVARGGERQFQRFKKQFDNTFWFYMNLIDPATLKK
jgi:tetratricopeptide (TPR) repeat protein